LSSKTSSYRFPPSLSPISRLAYTKYGRAAGPIIIDPSCAHEFSHRIGQAAAPGGLPSIPENGLGPCDDIGGGSRTARQYGARPHRPVIGVTSSFIRCASARNPGSATMASKPARKRGHTVRGHFVGHHEKAGPTARGAIRKIIEFAVAFVLHQIAAEMAPTGRGPGTSVGESRTTMLIFLSLSQSSGTEVQPPQSPSISRPFDGQALVGATCIALDLVYFHPEEVAAACRCRRLPAVPEARRAP